MIRYILRRIILLAVTMLVTSILIFVLTQLLPGDVARLQLGRDASEAQLTAFRERYGLNNPVPQQFVNWLSGFMVGNWGVSFSSGSPPVRPLVLERLENSLLLGGLTLLISVPLSILLGMLAALRENSWVDASISLLSLGVVGLPEFVTGILLIGLFALNLKWFPATSLIDETYNIVDWLRILILPAITATLVLLGYISRLTRAGVIEELKKPYVRTATLKGLSQSQIIIKHVLRNALLPTITVIALSIGWLIGGLIVIESVFNYPGLGALMVTAVEQKNTPLLQAVVMVIIFTIAVSNLIADILYAVLNPRVRLG
jgi:peptide/nickel transport system permease protein